MCSVGLEGKVGAPRNIAHVDDSNQGGNCALTVREKESGTQKHTHLSQTHTHPRGRTDLPAGAKTPNEAHLATMK